MLPEWPGKPWLKDHVPNISNDLAICGALGLIEAFVRRK
jgi:hypothetical protein